MTHSVSAAPAARSRWIAGSATLTTVPSMKARLEPSTVAASVRVRAAGLAVLTGGCAQRSTPASHGPLCAPIMDCLRQRGLRHLQSPDDRSSITNERRTRAALGPVGDDRVV